MTFYRFYLKCSSVVFFQYQKLSQQMYSQGDTRPLFEANLVCILLHSELDFFINYFQFCIRPFVLPVRELIQVFAIVALELPYYLLLCNCITLCVIRKSPEVWEKMPFSKLQSQTFVRIVTDPGPNPDLIIWLKTEWKLGLFPILKWLITKNAGFWDWGQKSSQSQFCFLWLGSETAED